MPNFNLNETLLKVLKNNPEFTDKVNDLMDEVDNYKTAKAEKKASEEKTDEWREQVDAFISLLGAIGEAAVKSMTKTDDVGEDELLKEECSEEPSGDVEAGVEADARETDDLERDECDDSDHCSCDKCAGCSCYDKCFGIDEDTEVMARAIKKSLGSNPLDYTMAYLADKILDVLFGVTDGIQASQNGSVFPILAPTEPYKPINCWCLTLNNVNGFISAYLTADSASTDKHKDSLTSRLTSLFNDFGLSVINIFMSPDNSNLQIDFSVIA